MEIIIFILALVLINAQFLDINTIDLSLGSDNFYRIKNIDSDLKFKFDNETKLNILPEKYLNLIIMILKNQKIFYNCQTKTIVANYIKYEFFFCEKNTGIKDIKIELHFNFDNFNITLTESQIFSIENITTYYFNFWAMDIYDYVIISDKLIKSGKNEKVRKLDDDDDDKSK